MRHQNAYRRFSRTASHRRSLLRNLATSLLRQERFETTVEKAKDLKPVVEKLITLAKKETLAAKRAAYSYLLDKDVVHKLFAEIGPRYKDRKGGYARVVKSGYRHGDAASLAVIELLKDEAKAAPKKKKATRKKKTEAAESAKEPAAAAQP